MVMKKKKEQKIITLKDWYQNLPAVDQRDTLLELCQHLGKSEETLYRWIRGAAFPDIANRKLIEEFTETMLYWPENSNKVIIQP